MIKQFLNSLKQTIVQEAKDETESLVDYSEGSFVFDKVQAAASCDEVCSLTVQETQALAGYVQQLQWWMERAQQSGELAKPAGIPATPPPDPDLDRQSPYEGHGWAGTTWHCIRCGSALQEIPKSDDGGWTWRVMQTKGYLLLRCSNQQCCHHHGDLTVHHPYSTERGPGESYSVSWIR